MDNASQTRITRQIYISHHENDAESAKEVQSIIRAWGYTDVYLDDEYTGESHFMDSQIIIALISSDSWTSQYLRATWGQPNEDRQREDRQRGIKNYLRQTFYIRLNSFEIPEEMLEFVDYDNVDSMAILNYKLRLHFDMRRNSLSVGSIAQEIEENITFIDKTLQTIVSKKIPDDNRFITGEKVEQDDEAILVQRMYHAWLNGILIPALNEAVLFGDAIQPDIAVRAEAYGSFAETIPQNELDFVKMSTKLNSFVILGEPGSGKTIFFLQLATQLLRLYVENWDKKPNRYNLPLILNLSSWGRPEPEYDTFSVKEWILHEAERIYRIDHRKIEEWLDSSRFVLFFDGLDEIADDKRPARIEKINQFNQDTITGSVQMIVCCRKKEYEESDKQGALVFKNVVEMQDLRPKQIKSYIDKDQQSHLYKLYTTYADIEALIKIPFLFIMMKRVSDSHSFNVDDSKFPNFSQGDWIRYLTDGYIERQLYDSPHPSQRVKETLEWLGHKMQIYGVVFRIDLINIGWFNPPVYKDKNKIGWREKVPYHFIHQGCLYTVLFFLPIVSAVIFANAVAGMVGAAILGSLVLIFTVIVQRGFFFNQQYYYDFSYKTLWERLFSSRKPPKIDTTGHLGIVAGMVSLAVLVWGIPQLVIALDNNFFTFLILSIFWAIVIAIGGYVSLDYLRKPNPAQLVLVAILPLTGLLVSMLYFFNQAFLQYPAFQIVVGTGTSVLVTGIIATVQGDKTPPLLIKRKSLIPIISVVVLAIGLGFLVISPLSGFLAVLLTISLAFLIVSGLRWLQIRLFYWFILIRFKLHYRQIMKYLVERNILRNFAGGFTFRHDYFFQRYIKGTMTLRLEEQVNILIKTLYNQLGSQSYVDINLDTPVIKDLLALGPSITPQLVREMTESRDDRFLQALVLILTQPGMRAAIDIVDRFARANDTTLYYFVLILIEIGDHITMDAIINKANHAYKLVRMRVFEALGRIDNDKAVDTLINRFRIEKDKDAKMLIEKLLRESKRKTMEIRQLLD